MGNTQGRDEISIVVVGDGAVGKTSFLWCYYNQKLLQSDVYIPTIFDQTQVEVPYKGKIVKLNLYDTAGQEDYMVLRKLALQEAGICLVCYSSDNRVSFNNVTQKWIPEVRKECPPKVPILLVGTKSDRANEPGAVTLQEGESLAKAHKIKFVGCSAKTDLDSVQTVFHTVINMYFKKKTLLGI